MPYTCKIPLQFTAPERDLIQAAQEIGRRSGLDSDWVPQSIEEALFEILISSGNPLSHNVIVLGSEEATRGDVFVLQASISLNAPREQIFKDHKGLLDPRKQVNFDNLMIELLQIQKPPADYGFEINDAVTPTHTLSAHEKMESHARIRRATITKDKT